MKSPNSLIFPLRSASARQVTKSIFALVTALSVTAFGADTAYDGGKATSPKDLKGKKVVLADIPKLVGIGYFNATAKGIAAACAQMSQNAIPTHVNPDSPPDRHI